MLHIYWERFCKWFTAYVFPHSGEKKQWKESFLLLSTLEWKSASTSTFLPGIPAPRARQFKLSWLLFVVVWHKRKKKTTTTKTRGKTFLINILNENIVTLLFLSLGRLTYVIFFPVSVGGKKGGKERPIFAFPPRSRLTLDSPGQISMCFCWLGGALREWGSYGTTILNFDGAFSTRCYLRHESLGSLSCFQQGLKTFE